MLDALDSYETITLLLGGFLLVLIIVYFTYRLLGKNRQLRKIRRVVKKISGDFLANTSLDMGEDQYAYFDYILLHKDGIIVLELKDYAGHIFASEQINQWTQVLAGKSYKFTNPFFELERKIELLRQVLPGQKIQALILFTDSADFPKGRPQNVLLLKELGAQFVKTNAKDIAETEKSAWRQLTTYLSTDN